MTLSKLAKFMLGPLLLWACVIPQYVYGQSCDACQKKYRAGCGKSCEAMRNAKAFDACSDTCVQKLCDKMCTSEEISLNARGGDPEFKCKACMQKAASGECLQECEPGSPRYKVCVNKCSKQVCESKCDLPLSGDDTQEHGKYDCQLCLEKNKYVCAQNPDCPSGPGRVACQVACQQEKCSSECTGD